jgi:hypothetical protein
MNLSIHELSADDMIGDRGNGVVLRPQFSAPMIMFILVSMVSNIVLLKRWPCDI